MFGDSNSKSAPSVMTLRAQSAIYGVVLPALRGTTRVAGKLIDWTNFQAITEKQSAGGGSSFGGSTTSYDYKAAVDIALAMSPGCIGIGLIWDGQGKYGNGNVEETFSIPSGAPGSYTPEQALEWSYDVGVSLITTEQVWVPAYDPGTGLPQSGGAPGVGDGYYTTQNVYTPMVKVGGDPAQGQYKITGSGATRAYLFNYADADKDALLTYGLTVNLANEFEFFSGSRPQSPWAYMASANPGRACSYAGTCHVAAEAFDLGSSGQLNNLNFELLGPGIFGGGIQDAAIDQCIHLVLDDPDGGCGFPPALIGDLNAVINYCVAAGIFFSPLMDKQQTAASYLQDFCEAANIAASWSDGVYKFIPYGDTPLAGNGKGYIPDLTPIYDLDDDDFLAEEDEPPLKVEREDPETLANIFEVDILDRTLDYNTNPIKDRDSSLVFRFGPIPESPRKYDFICDPTVGAIVVNHIRLRATQIDTMTVTFKLGWQYELLEKMDIVTITCVELGWVKKPFRLKEYDEDPETGATEWTAEPVVWGSCNATLHPKQAPGGSGTQRDAAPGSVLPPIIFEAPDPINDGQYQLWLGLSGATLANWGGCHVYLSPDGTTYKNVLPGQSGPCRMGVLTADFPALVPAVPLPSSALDLVNTLTVDLGESGGALLSASAADRDAFLTLCWVEGPLITRRLPGRILRTVNYGLWELISYETAALVSGNLYQLTGIQRGVYGSPVIDHPAGCRFLRCDDAVTKLNFPASAVGTTAYIKATSFNHLGLAEEDVSAVAAYPYPVGGLFNNSLQGVNTDATVDSVGTGGPPFTAATVRVYGAAGVIDGVEGGVTIVKADGVTFATVFGFAFPGLALSTWYWVMYSVMQQTFYVVTSVAAMQAAVYIGDIYCGSTQTPSADGVGATSIPQNPWPPSSF